MAERLCFCLRELWSFRPLNCSPVLGTGLDLAVSGSLQRPSLTVHPLPISPSPLLRHHLLCENSWSLCVSVTALLSVISWRAGPLSVPFTGCPPHPYQCLGHAGLPNLANCSLNSHAAVLFWAIALRCPLLETF